MDPIFASIVLAFFLSVIAVTAMTRGYLTIATKVTEILGKLLGTDFQKTEE